MSFRGLSRSWLPIFLVFLFVSAISFFSRQLLSSLGTDYLVLLAGNGILFAITLASFLLYRRGLTAATTHAFLRNVYSGMLLKLFVCAGAAFVYISAAGDRLNRPGLFTVMFLYLVYTMLEIALLMRQSREIKEQKNA